MLINLFGYKNIKNIKIINVKTNSSLKKLDPPFIINLTLKYLYLKNYQANKSLINSKNSSLSVFDQKFW